MWQPLGSGGRFDGFFFLFWKAGKAYYCKVKGKNEQRKAIKPNINSSLLFFLLFRSTQRKTERTSSRKRQNLLPLRMILRSFGCIRDPFRSFMSKGFGFVRNRGFRIRRSGSVLYWVTKSRFGKRRNEESLRSPEVSFLIHHTSGTSWEFMDNLGQER